MAGTTNTLMIFESTEAAARLLWLDGDYSHLHQLYINGGVEDSQPLLEAAYGPDGDQPFQFEEQQIAPEQVPVKIHAAVAAGGTVHVVICGETA